MSNLTNIMDDSVYLARDYSAIIRWFATKVKNWTSDWTDMSISEPDTLSLSYIANVFDFMNYLIDSKYIETIFSKTTSIRFLSYLYKIVGSELEDYQSGSVKVTITNKSLETININKLDIFNIKNHHNELFTSIDNCEVPPKSSMQLTLVRGTPIYYELNKTQFSNGFFVLNIQNINRNSIMILIDGELSINESKDALFDSSVSFSKHQYGEYYTSIRLSPSAYRKIEKSVVVIYTINDEYPVARNTQLQMLNNPDGNYEIYTNTTNDIKEITLNEIKRRYYELLRTVDSLYNENYDVSEFLFGRVDYISYKYVTESKFESGTIDYQSGRLVLIYNEIPSSNVVLKYIYYYGNERVTHTEELTITDTETELDLYVPTRNYKIEPGSVRLEYDGNYLADSSKEGIIKLIKGDTVIKFNFSTSDDKPIIDLMKHGQVDYNSYSIDIELNYVPTDNIIISYSYLDPTGKLVNARDYYQIISELNYLLLDIPEGSEMIKSSVIIENGYNIIKDNNGELYNYQSDESILRDKLLSKLMINDTQDIIVLNKLSIKRINITAKVHLYSSDISTEVIRMSIEQALYDNYKKGTHSPGETIKRLPILLTIENSNASINYATLELPVMDVAVEENQISEIGSINISFERSDD